MEMSEEEIKILDGYSWGDSINIIQKYWNTDYGTCELCKEKDKETLELTTGGWSENEEILKQLIETYFWFFWWQESKRGGYYKFVYTKETEEFYRSLREEE